MPLYSYVHISDLQKLQDVLLPELLNCRDVHHSYISASDGEEQSALRDAVTLHLVNHVWKYVDLHSLSLSSAVGSENCFVLS